MKRKTAAAVLLGAALFVTGCSGNTDSAVTSAEETQTAAETEAPSGDTEAESEEDSESDTEAQSEGQSESDTEAQTEAAETEPSYQALDYVTLGDYTGLEVTLLKIEATDEEVQEQVDANIQSSGKMETLDEGTVENGDIAVIDFEGKLNGEAFEGGTSKDYELEIGSGSFIDGFEDGLIGVDVGETVDLNLTFPEGYSNSELAGQDVVFTVTVNEIQRVPELTDGLAAELNEDCDTADAYREYVRESILTSKRENQYGQMLNDLYTQIYTGSTINSYPEDVVSFRTAQMRAYYESMAEESDMEFADFLSQYLSMTEDDFNSQATAIVQASMAQELLMNAIAEQEKLEVDDTYYEENIDSYVEMTGADSRETLVSTYGEETLRETMRMDMAMNFVVDHCVITNPEDQVEEEDTEAETAAGTETEAAEAQADASEAQTEADTETSEETAAAETETESAEDTAQVSETESAEDTAQASETESGTEAQTEAQS